MCINDGPMSLGFAHAIPQVGDKLFKCPDLGLGRSVAIEVADKADAERDVIEIVTGDMASVELGRPAVSCLDLTISRSVAVPDHKMIGQSIFHVADAEMINVEDPCISLSGAAVVNDDIFPTTPVHRGVVNGRTRGGTQVVVASA